MSEALGKRLNEMEPKTPAELFPAGNGKMKAAEAIPEILKILAGVDRKYHPVIFDTVLRLDRIDKGEDVTEIDARLKELARERRQREIEQDQPQGWWRRRNGN
ncbi:MAG: hypothetical protein ACP5I1_19665 [Candidatus Hinthialibacter sp.]